MEWNMTKGSQAVCRTYITAPLSALKPVITWESIIASLQRDWISLAGLMHEQLPVK